MENHNQIKPPKQTQWYREITVEPTMFLYMFAFMLTSVVEQAFFIHKACIVNHQLPRNICDNIDKEENQDYKKLVQLTVTDFHQWNNVIGHVFPIVLALFLGSWSDRRGRKFPLLMGIVGKFIYSVMIIVNDQMPNWPVEYVIYTATIPCALSGADVAIFASCFAYISDVSTAETRTMRVTILDVCYLLTMPTGVALGSFLFAKVFNKSFTWMFTVNASLLVVSIIYSLLALKWQTNAKQRSLREVGCLGIVGDFFDKKHLVDSFKVLTKRRELHRRLFIAIFLTSMALYTFQRDEKNFLYLYTQLRWNWDVPTFSNFKTFQSSAYVLVMLMAIPFLSKKLKWRDTSIAMLGSTAHALARVVYIFAKVPWVFYIGSAICSFGPIVGPVLRSMTSKTVPISERGKIFALLSVCDNAVPFISVVLYGQVYKASMDRFGGIFWLTFATQVAVFGLMFIVHKILGNHNLAAEEQDKNDTLIEQGQKPPVLTQNS